MTNEEKDIVALMLSNQTYLQMSDVNIVSTAINLADEMIKQLKKR